ncbi:hypothetical protein WDW37_06320 [Bdellovibrionota bacterium FG-1]
MTTAVELADDQGQSVLEFLLMLPMMVGLVVILVKINTTIQISINNQQYARAQALWLTFNSPVYPAHDLKEGHLTAKQYNQMVIGVSENQATAGEYNPKAATYLIARKKGSPAGEEKAEPRERTLVRIRDTVTLCTQSNLIKTGGGMTPILDVKSIGKNAVSPAGNYKLIEDPHQFDYCSSPMSYETGGGDS